MNTHPKGIRGFLAGAAAAVVGLFIGREKRDRIRQSKGLPHGPVDIGKGSGGQFKKMSARQERNHKKALLGLLGIKAHRSCYFWPCWKRDGYASPGEHIATPSRVRFRAPAI